MNTGSVRQLVDADGNVMLGRRYEPYGEVLGAAGDGESSYGYTNEWTDGSTNLIYLRTRWYYPETGRFLTRDSWQGDGTWPISFNKWNYVESNPINLTDPSGQNPGIVAALLPSLVGVTASIAGGAVAAGVFGACTYDWALAGKCGCDLQQMATSMTRAEWIGAHALSGGLIAGFSAALMAAAPVGIILVGGIGVGVGLEDIIDTIYVIKNEAGLTQCTISRLLLDVVQVVFSISTVKVGIRAFLASGSLLQWSGPGFGYWGPRKGSVKGSVYENKIRQSHGHPLDQNYFVSDGYNTVAFDDAIEGGRILIDAKESSGNSIYDLVNTEDWAAERVLSQANRQVRAAKFNRAKIEWYVSNPSTTTQLQILIMREKRLPIVVKYVPIP